MQYVNICAFIQNLLLQKMCLFMTTATLEISQKIAQRKAFPAIAFIRAHTNAISVGIVFGAAFLVGIYNLNYNSPFSDEAIYIVIGKMGLFQHDWFSYNVSSWMAGLPFFYPSVTATAYAIGGIVASRFMNVLFGMFMLIEIFFITQFTPRGQEKIKTIAATIAVFIVGFSAIQLNVSRLATYDAMSFFFLLYGTNHLLQAPHQKSGKFYFIGGLSLVLAVCTKIIIAIFIPPLVLFSFFAVWSNKKKFRLWRQYFMYTLNAGIASYVLLNSKGLLVYAVGQSVREHVANAKIAQLIWYDASFALILAAVAVAVVFIFFKHWTNILYLGFFAALIPLLHFGTHRFSTLEKHILLTIIFLAPIIGYAWGFILTSKYKIIRGVGTFALGMIVVLYPLTEYTKLVAIEKPWPNTDHMVVALSKIAKTNDIILTDTGPAVILGVYDKVKPTDVITFDWIRYGTVKGDQAYIQAVHDGYFDVIELDGKTEAKRALVENIRKELGSNYTLKYSEKPFEIYERNY